MAEIVLSVVIRKVANMVFDAIKHKFVELKSTQRLLDDLKRNLPVIQEAQNYAASRFEEGSKLSECLKQVKDAIYEAEDLVDELDYEQKMSQVSKSEFYFKKWLESFGRVEKLKAIVSKLHNLTEYILTLAKMFELNDGKKEGGTSEMVESTSLMDDDEKYKFVGREKDKSLIIDILMAAQSRWRSDQSSSSSSDPGSSAGQKGKQIVDPVNAGEGEELEEGDLVVIPIVGIGGVGKTTLARVIYNDPMIQKHFHLMSWVCVSNRHDAKKIMSDIVNNFDDFAGINSWSLEKISNKCVNIISGSRFLLVLDDLSVNLHWDPIRKALSKGRGKRAVLVTTQFERVAKLVGTMEPLKLETLKETEYWNLFEHHTFGYGNKLSGSKERLVGIAKEISRNLNGLPLAAKVLGALLRDNINEEFWQKISESGWWQNKDVVKQILPSLGLSYQYLDAHLKQCFAYCAIFPNNFLFEKNAIVQMWIAQGYIQSKDIRVEDAGSDYFDKLIERSFFEPAWKNRYVIHASMLELAKFVSRDDCYVMEVQPTNPPQMVRHLTIKMDISPKVVELISSYKLLRTLLVFGKWENDNDLDETLKQLKSLRVLDLSYAFPKGLNLPHSIGDLSHLRYLDMRENDKISLPNPFCNLFHLQVLNINGCGVEKLPNGIGNLISLRHLYAEETVMDEICVSKMTDLQELARFSAAFNRNRNGIEDLEKLNQLHGSLSIVGLASVKGEEEASKANIKEKKYLSHLSLGIYRSDKPPLPYPFEQQDKKVFGALQPHPNIKELEIYGYGDRHLPVWMLEIRVLSKLQFVSLRKCRRLECLPPFGQLHFLRRLILEDLDSVRTIGKEFYDNHGEISFANLEELRLLSLKCLTKWEEYSTAPCFTSLKRLQIKNCPVLENDLSLLHHANLEMIALLGCPKLLASTLNKEQLWPSLSSITHLTTDYTVLKDDGSVAISRLPSLQTLNIECLNISKFSVEQESWFKQLISLKVLKFKRCRNLSSLPASLGTLPVWKLTIGECNSIKSVLENGLPATLEVLRIYDSSGLERRCKAREGIDWERLKNILVANFQPEKEHDEDPDWNS